MELVGDRGSPRTSTAELNNHANELVHDVEAGEIVVVTASRETRGCASRLS